MAPVSLLLEKNDQQKSPPPAIEPGESDVEGDETFLLCATCGQIITSPQHAIAVGGKHEHTQLNPSGRVFHLGCFQNANCLAVGKPTDEFSWFAGYQWQFALCSGCQCHLGWFFSGSASFWGLIYATLRSS